MNHWLIITNSVDRITFVFATQKPKYKVSFHNLQFLCRIDLIRNILIPDKCPHRVLQVPVFGECIGRKCAPRCFSSNLCLLKTVWPKHEHIVFMWSPMPPTSFFQLAKQEKGIINSKEELNIICKERSILYIKALCIYC